MVLPGCIGVSQAHRPGTASIQKCLNGVRPAADGALDDFEDGNMQLTKLAKRDGYFWPMKDEDGSTVTAVLDDDGADGSDIAMHIFGVTVGTGKVAWGAGLGVDLTGKSGSYDASKYVGVAFKAKAGPTSTRKLRFHMGDVNTRKEGGVCSRCFNHFGADLSLTGDWREYRILFADAQQEPGWGDPHPPSITPGKLRTLEWKIGPGQAFDVWIDDIVFLECKP
jgi:endoglucanase